MGHIFGFIRIILMYNKEYNKVLGVNHGQGDYVHVARYAVMMTCEVFINNNMF